MSADDMIARGELEEVAADREGAAASELEDAIEIATQSVEICGQD